jgi:hypothetical protein
LPHGVAGQLACHSPVSYWRCEKTFVRLLSPPETTFEREEWTVMAEGVIHLQLVLTPEKGGKSYHATLTSLALQ